MLRCAFRRTALAAAFVAINVHGASAQCVTCFGDLNAIRPGATIEVTNPAARTMTILPDGRGDTLEELGITLRVRVFCEYLGGPPIGPLCNLPAQDILLWSPNLCFCSDWHPTGPSDQNGEMQFTGTVRGGGCATSLTLFIDGVAATVIPFRINSPDTRTASPCSVDASDLPAVVERLGHPDRYDFCFDYNEDGFTDAGDLAWFSFALGAACAP